jgi:hypothetical protein
MLKTATISVIAAVAAFAAGTLSGRTSSSAAEEVRCRVNVPAFLSDMRAIGDVNEDLIKNVLKPKP